MGKNVAPHIKVCRMIDKAIAAYLEEHPKPLNLAVLIGRAAFDALRMSPDYIQRPWALDFIPTFHFSPAHKGYVVTEAGTVWVYSDRTLDPGYILVMPMIEAVERTTKLNEERS